jgi:hypothetical protein
MRPTAGQEWTTRLSLSLSDKHSCPASVFSLASFCYCQEVTKTKFSDCMQRKFTGVIFYYTIHASTNLEPKTASIHVPCLWIPMSFPAATRGCLFFLLILKKTLNKGLMEGRVSAARRRAADPSERTASRHARAYGMDHGSSHRPPSSRQDRPGVVGVLVYASTSF